jgi:molybdopterin-guanine dinucleotide biosynthesis protein B
MRAGGGPFVVCVIGKKKSGKTTTTVGLIRELARRGHRVMSAKHGHGFELDAAGTDSWRHRHEGGAHRVAMAGPEQVAVLGGWDGGGEQPLEALVREYLHDAGIVVAEGFKTSSFPKIEVYRREAHEEPLYGRDPEGDGRYLAILTDVTDFAAHVPVMDLGDDARFARLADLIESNLSREDR